MQAVNDTLNDAFGQRQISTIYAQANQYRVVLEAQAATSEDPNSLLEALPARRSGRRTQVPLGAVATHRAARPRRSSSRHRSSSRR